MANQRIIDKHLSEFYETHRKTIPIEVNAYIHRIVDEHMDLNNGLTFDEWLKNALGVVKDSIKNKK